METDWSALLKAVFGSAYHLVEYPDVPSTSGCRRQQRFLYVTRRRCPQYLLPTGARHGHTCAASAVEASWPRDVTVTSFPVSGSISPRRSARMSAMAPSNAAATDGCYDETVCGERFSYRASPQARIAVIHNVTAYTRQCTGCANKKNNPLEKMLYFSHGNTELSQTSIGA